MALRLGFPLGLLATTLGYAALGAVAGLALIPDFLGHLPRLVLLCAIGAGLLGVLAWTTSERLADAVNLNTRPFKRLALAGAAGVMVATLLAGAFAEFAVGTQAGWVQPATVALYVAAGLPPLVAVLGPLAGLETALAARRGDAAVMDSLRPLLRHVVLGAVLAGGIAFGLVEYRVLAQQSLAALAPDMPRASLWNARQEKLFAPPQAGARCDVLVAPVEASEPSIDRVARSLMTRMIAAEIAARGLCVADPTLVARALGASRRRVDERTLWQLATALSAQWVIRGEVTLDSELPRFDVALAALERQGQGFGQARDVELAPALFSEVLPPEAVFAAGVAAAVDRLDLGGTAEAAAQPEAASRFPDDPLHLAHDPGRPRLRALRLQLLAAAYAPEEIAGEHLWERSLVALRGLDDEGAQVLRARAALHLHRRPYAMALLEGLQSPEAAAVRAAAQGDLPQLDATPREGMDPAFWLVTRIEAERLRLAYGASAGFEARRAAVLDAFPAYRPWLEPALTPSQRHSPASASRISGALRALGADLPASRWAWLHNVAGALGWAPPLPAELSAHDLDRSYALLWQTRGEQWRTLRADDRLAIWDLFDALYASHRAATAAAAATLAGAQGEVDPAALSARFMALHAGGQPALTGWIARTLAAGAAAQPAHPEAGLHALRAQRLARDVLAWEEGESGAARIVAPLAQARLQDEPPRAWRFAAAGADPQLAEERLADALVALQYTVTNFAFLERAQGLLRQLGREEQAQRLIAEQQSRFAGHPARENFLLTRAEDGADVPTVVALWQARVRANPQAWEARLQLARAQLRARDPDAAQRTLLEAPALARTDAPAPDLAGRLHEAAALLHAAGETQRAAPVYERAAAAGSSPAALRSAQLLAHIRGDFGAARDRAQQQYDQHASAGALADVSYYSFMLGDMDRGWRAFYESSRVAQDYRPWSAAQAGHRIAAAKADDIVKFVQLWKGVSSRPEADALRKEHFAFNYALVDRVPGEEGLALLRGFAGKSGDDRYQVTGEAYAAWLRDDPARAAALLGAPEGTPLPASAVPAGARAHALPYLASALVRGGREGDARSALAEYRSRSGRDFHYLLARAYLEGLTARRDASLALLWEAMLSKPAGDGQALPPGFQLLEACDKLHKVTGEAGYRELLLDLAHRQQRVWPDSWAYAFEARHANDAAARQRALAAALYLDPKSEQLRAMPEPERKRVQQWLAQGKVF